MTTLLALLLAATSTDLANLDFGDRRLTHWNGTGFDVADGVTSKDGERAGRKGLLHRTFVVPPGAGTLHFSASASADHEHLNVYLEAAERELVPKYVRTARGFEKSPNLRLADDGKPREYMWTIADRVGETLRILIVDQSDTPGHHVFCSGFRMEKVNAFETREFTRLMTALVREHRLPTLADPLTSKHFLAMGNADEKFIQGQLEQCELMHQLFLNHFRVKGFKLKQPATRLMVAVFSSQEGFEAYLGQRMPAGATGLYHPRTNRLVVYDFGRSRSLVESKKRFEDEIRHFNDLDRAHLLGQLQRHADELRADTNLSTIMHEVAHQMSLNTGLLNRDGDLPLWLVEGIATYCEPTDHGFWQGVGARNVERLKTLRRVGKEDAELLPLRSLVESDRWLRGSDGPPKALMGYAQSWALVRMLMEEQPRTFRRYTETIKARRTPDHRLTDFVEVFGDLAKLERRHKDYVKKVVELNP